MKLPLTTWCSRLAAAHTDAHNFVLRKVADLCSSAGARTDPEDRSMVDNKRDRVDITAAFHDRAILIDVVGTMAANPRTVSADPAPGAAANSDLRKQRHLRYQLMAATFPVNGIFIAFSFERHGCIGSQALDLLEFLIARFITSSTLSSNFLASVRCRFLRDISRAIQEGNAHILAEGLRISRAAALSAACPTGSSVCNAGI
eukprot:gb/GEZN01007617.1/.p2 GENE.gb/GEZN01007617.1/~~gb/GEZN01007617.1/.p2  ORF type:complete len:202 (+),score=11.18 gb/GEZN01007617.1/:767-1372(+)